MFIGYLSAMKFIEGETGGKNERDLLMYAQDIVEDGYKYTKLNTLTHFVECVEIRYRKGTDGTFEVDFVSRIHKYDQQERQYSYKLDTFRRQRAGSHYYQWEHSGSSDFTFTGKPVNNTIWMF